MNFFNKLKFIPLVVVLFSTPIHAQTQFYFFGDSTSDGGVMDNNPGIVTTKHHIYTNALHENDNVWPYYLSQVFNKAYAVNNQASTGDAVSGQLHGNNYAAGGAVSRGTGIGFEHYAPASLAEQVQQFTSEHANDENLNHNVYFIWIGANDYLSILAKNPLLDLPDFLALLPKLGALPNQLSDEVMSQIQHLQAMGAAGHHPDKFVIINLPNFSQTPLLSFIPSSIDLSASYNQALNKKLSQTYQLVSASHHASLYQSKENQTEILLFDVHQLLGDVINQVQETGRYDYQGDAEFAKALAITNVDTSACHTDADPLSLQGMAIACTYWATGAQMDNYLFADGMHPSVTAHKVFADQLAQLLTKHGWLG